MGKKNNRNRKPKAPKQPANGVINTIHPTAEAVEAGISHDEVVQVIDDAKAALNGSEPLVVGVSTTDPQEPEAPKEEQPITESTKPETSKEESEMEEVPTPPKVDENIGDGVNGLPREIKKLGGVEKLRAKINAKREAAKAAEQPRV